LVLGEQIRIDRRHRTIRNKGRGADALVGNRREKDMDEVSKR